MRGDRGSNPGPVGYRRYALPLHQARPLNKDRIQAMEQLKKKNWKGSKLCKMCGSVETPTHVIFECPTANYVWCILRDGLKWAKLGNISEANLKIMTKRSGEEKRITTIIISAACWTIWLAINDYVFRNMVLSTPESLAYKLTTMLQKWSAKSNAGMGERIQEASAAIEQQVRKTVEMSGGGSV
ncbi:hypothetical protein QOZ80_5BG0424700 [Eleusine coracana subsp. coracana]|nr:hypothetical protein QOZ80_5BG0424700 [Eleusine coracana subsp. coracana]